MTTIQELYKHVSNKIANKVGDPWDDLWATVIPVDNQGGFCKPLSADDREEFQGDAYELLKYLCFNTEKLPTHTYGFFAPAYKKDPETFERIGKIITFVMVHDSNNIEFMVWDLEDNSVGEPMMHTDELSGGTLSIALGALSFKWDIDNGVEDTELARVTKELFANAKHTAELLERARQLKDNQ